MSKFGLGPVLLLWALILASVKSHGGHDKFQEGAEVAPRFTEAPPPTPATEPSVTITITDAPDLDGDTLLHLAAQQGNISAVKELLSNNASVNALNDQLQNPLHIAAHRAAVTCSADSTCMDIPKLLINAGTDLYIKDKDNRTFLHLLLWLDTTLNPSQFQEFAEFLVLQNHTALFNVPGWKDSSTPFQLAVQAMEVPQPTLNLFHEHGVNFSAIDSDGDSVLSYALAGCRQRSLPFLAMLVKYGADVKHLNRRNESFLHRAAYCGSRVNMIYFIFKHVDVNGVNDWKETPLHLVTKFVHKDLLGCVELLVQSRADKQAKDRDWRTALDIAEGRNDFRDREKVLKLLIPDTDTEANTITNSNQTGTGNKAILSHSGCSRSSSLKSSIQPIPLLLLQIYMAATCFVL